MVRRRSKRDADSESHHHPLALRLRPDRFPSPPPPRPDSLPAGGYRLNRGDSPAHPSSLRRSTPILTRFEIPEI